MKVIYGQCGSCDYIAEYDIGFMKTPVYVRCKKCKSNSVWRIYTPAELDLMREGERVE